MKCTYCDSEADGELDICEECYVNPKHEESYDEIADRENKILDQQERDYDKRSR